MIKVSIIGSGNVAQHLIAAFAKSNEVELLQVFARKKESITHLLDSDKIITDKNNLAEADLIIIAVSDHAIATVSSGINLKNQLVVHTSGGVAINDLDDKNRKGVFYPLQSFSKNKAVDFKSIPICLEAENPTDYQLLHKLAKTISDTVYPINTNQRKALHVAAVFTNNFVNHLYQIGSDICNENQVPFEILKPLIQETASKIMLLSPEEAQTGPAKRQDITTIENHIAFLSDENQKDIYNLLTQSIQDDAQKL
ncbi:MAG: Rossmann-like and DUF2520 domain-containing protein [Bacteroidota bacterium]